MSNGKAARDPDAPEKGIRAPASLALPASIAFAAVVLAIGLYAGLREGRAPEHPAAAAAGTPNGASVAVASKPATRASAAPPAVPGQPSAPAVDEARKRATEEARVALEGQRAQLVAACWTKAAAAKPLPASAGFVYAIAFSSDGRELGRAVNEAKIGERPEVAACLRMAVSPVVVSPPGQAFTAKVPLTLP